MPLILVGCVCVVVLPLGMALAFGGLALVTGLVLLPSDRAAVPSLLALGAAIGYVIVGGVAIASDSPRNGLLVPVGLVVLVVRKAALAVPGVDYR